MNYLNWVIVILITILINACTTHKQDITTTQYIQYIAQKPSKPLRMVRQYHFEANDTQLNTTAQSDLLAYAKYLKQNPSIIVRIDGHADLNEPIEKIMPLSIDRAQTIAQFLIDQGVSRTQIDIQIFGSHQSTLQTKMPSIHASNRRAVISFEMNAAETA